MTEKNTEPDFSGLITLLTDGTDGATDAAVCGPEGCTTGEIAPR